MTGSPLDVLRDESENLADLAIGWCAPSTRGSEALIAQTLDKHQAALAQVETLVEAARAYVDFTEGVHEIPFEEFADWQMEGNNSWESFQAALAPFVSGSGKADASTPLTGSEGETA